jgi:ABC-type nitrate/sulfonate/bicarbonate transport system substrate-binding protein
MVLASGVIAACGSSAATGNSSPGATSAGGLPAPEKTDINLAVLSSSSNHNGEVAIEDGLFTKYGLNVTYKVFTSETSQDQALLSGQEDFIVNAGAPSVIGSLLTSSPLVVPVVDHDTFTDDLYTAANVHSAQDLKGKAVAISTFASSLYGEAIIMIESLGLQASDVQFTPIGNDGARRAALAAGTVAASLDDHAIQSQMLAAGFHDLTEGSKQTIGLPTSVAETTLAFTQKYPNTTLAIVAALLEGTHIFLTNLTETATAQAKFENISVPAATALVQADLPGWGPVNGRPTLAEWKAAQTLFAKTDPKLATVDVSKAFTTKFLDQLQSLGWYQKLGITP